MYWLCYHSWTGWVLCHPSQINCIVWCVWLPFLVWQGCHGYDYMHLQIAMVSVVPLVWLVIWVCQGVDWCNIKITSLIGLWCHSSGNLSCNLFLISLHLWSIIHYTVSDLYNRMVVQTWHIHNYGVYYIYLVSAIFVSVHVLTCQGSYNLMQYH